MPNLSSLLNWPKNVTPQQRLSAAEYATSMFGGIGPGILAGTITNFPIKGLRPLLDEGLITGKSQTPNAPILVDYDRFGNMYIADGTHRYYEALKKGLETIPGYFVPKTGKRLTIKEMIELAPEYNKQLFEVGPRRP